MVLALAASQDLLPQLIQPRRVSATWKSVGEHSQVRDSPKAKGSLLRGRWSQRAQCQGKPRWVCQGGWSQAAGTRYRCQFSSRPRAWPPSTPSAGLSLWLLPCRAPLLCLLLPQASQPRLCHSLSLCTPGHLSVCPWPYSIDMAPKSFWSFLCTLNPRR